MAEDSPATIIRVIQYSNATVKERQLESDEPIAHPSGAGVLWLDVQGLGSATEVERIGKSYGLHRLTLEDIVNTHQRPKTERFEGYEFIVMRVPSPGNSLHLTQLSVVLGDGFVLSFCEESSNLLEPIRRRIRERGGLINGAGPDYLAYAIIDAATDHFFPLMDAYAERLDAVERVVLEDPTAAVLSELYTIKEDLRECRRSVWPLRDLLNTLGREQHPLITPQTLLHLRDCQDHVSQLLELIESDRDTATALTELHVSAVGNRMNEVMKVLTIISTIFIPLSFIAGLYGMNFDTQVSPWNMPELSWRWGYPAVLLAMVTLAILMLWFFWRRGWLGPSTTIPSSLRETQSQPEDGDTSR